MNKFPIARTRDLVVNELGSEVLVYDLKANNAFCLNETSALIWQLCDGTRPVSEISKNLGKKLKSPVSEDLVWVAIDQLKKEDLLANGGELPSNFTGMNRRDVIKKVGLASMIALPMVLGITAPAAVQAASACSAAAAPPGNTNLCACNRPSAANGSEVGAPCTYNDARTCPAGCSPTFAQANNAVCTCK